MKKIAIAILANGPYKMFLDKLIDTARINFLKDHRRTFFVITDGGFDNSHSEDCKVHIQERKGWPLDCLLRPAYVASIEAELKEFDYVYFLGANLVILQEITESDIFPDESGLVAVEHLSFADRNNMRFTYDRNPHSAAYIPLGEGSVYYQAIVWGGTTEAYLKMNAVCAERTKIDMDNKVEAVWLDESHLNRYLYENPPKTISALFAWPEMSPTLSEIKILQLEKKKYINGNFKYVN